MMKKTIMTVLATTMLMAGGNAMANTTDAPLTPARKATKTTKVVKNNTNFCKVTEVISSNVFVCTNKKGESKKYFLSKVKRYDVDHIKGAKSKALLQMMTQGETVKIVEKNFVSSYSQATMANLYLLQGKKTTLINPTISKFVEETKLDYL